jgi:DHA2 family multidrug resistance protein
MGFLMFQGLLSMLIVQLQLSLGYSSFLAGLVFLPMAIFAKPIASVFHEVVKHFDARLLVTFNCLSFAAIYFWLSRFDGQDAFAELFWPKLLEGVCLGSFFVPLTALLLHGLPQERQWRAVELASLMRLAAGAIGITMQGIVLYQRTPLHMTRFAETQTSLDSGFEQMINTLIEAGFNESGAVAKLAKLAGRNSIIHGMNDAFWMAACIFVGLAMLVWFADPTKQPAHRTVKQEQRRETQEILAEEP